MGVATTETCHVWSSCASTIVILSAGAKRSTKNGLKTSVQTDLFGERRISLTSWIGSAKAFTSSTSVLDGDTFTGNSS